jgi:ABC-type multidrug transport system fused ATPase/permease subunit
MKPFVHKKRRYLIPPFVLLVIAVFSVIIMILWNVLMPAIFNLPTIKFWQATGLLVMSRLLFGMGHCNTPWTNNHMKNRLREKVAAMSPEERKEFFKKMHVRRYPWYQKDDEGAENEDDTKKH